MVPRAHSAIWFGESNQSYRLLSAAWYPARRMARDQQSLTMRKNLIAVLAAPLIMAALIFVPKFFSNLSTPLLISSIVFLIVFCFIFFWGCVWISAGIAHVFELTSSNATLVTNAAVQLSLTLIGASCTRLFFSHTFGWARVVGDGAEQTAAFIVALLAYWALRRPAAHVLT
jgi:hypothetical protein